MAKINKVKINDTVNYIDAPIVEISGNSGTLTTAQYNNLVNFDNALIKRGNAIYRQVQNSDSQLIYIRGSFNTIYSSYSDIENYRIIITKSSREWSYHLDRTKFYSQSQTDNTFQVKLVGSGDGQNIKTINNTSLLGTGDISINGITDISDQYIRVCNLNVGVYKLTYNGQKYIYYEGPNSTKSFALGYSYDTDILLHVTNKYTITLEPNVIYTTWYCICNRLSLTYPTIYYGYCNNNTNISYGYYTYKDISSLLTAHQSIKSLRTNNSTAQGTSSGETIAGSGYLDLHKVSKTGSYNDLLNKPNIPPSNPYPRIVWGDYMLVIAGKNSNSNWSKFDSGELMFYDGYEYYPRVTSQPYSYGTVGIYNDAEEGLYYIAPDDSASDIYLNLCDEENNGMFRFIYGFYSPTINNCNDPLAVCYLDFIIPEGDYNPMYPASSKLKIIRGANSHGYPTYVDYLTNKLNDKYVLDIEIYWDYPDGFSYGARYALPVIDYVKVYYYDGTSETISNPLNIVFNKLEYNSTTYNKSISPFEVVCLNELDILASTFVGGDN